MRAASTDVVIIGAGPYGLSLATHLSANGVDHRIFGFPMQTWANMPATSLLKSVGFGTTIPVASREPGFPAYCRSRGVEDYEPVPVSAFVRYGLDLQDRLVPQLEQARVTRVAATDGGFEVGLDDGQRLRCRRVVVAVGVAPFKHVPAELAGLPLEAVSHTSDHSDFARFAGAGVTVVGAGQSALEAAAFLHEAGASVRLVARERVQWGYRSEPTNLLDRIGHPDSVLGRGRKNFALEHFPSFVHYWPAERRLALTRTHLGPYGSWWLRDRVEGKVPIVEEARLARAEASGGKLRLEFARADGSPLEVLTDCVIAGTGYVVDLERLDFLDARLAAAVHRLQGAPALSRHFESSVRGLYFAGPAAASSFGPLLRFVAGAKYSVSVIARDLARTRPRAGHVRHPSPTLEGPVEE